MCKRSLPKVQFLPSFWRQNQTFLGVQVFLLPWVHWECRSIVVVLFCPLVALALLTSVLYHSGRLRVQSPVKAAGPSLKAWGLQTEPRVRGTPCNQASSDEPGVHAPFWRRRAQICGMRTSMGPARYSDHQDTHILSSIPSYSLWAGRFHFTQRG